MYTQHAASKPGTHYSCPGAVQHKALTSLFDGKSSRNVAAVLMCGNSLAVRTYDFVDPPNLRAHSTTRS